MSRRKFLKHSAAAAAGAAMLSSLSSSVYAAGDDAVKIGLVGMGGRGTGAANQALSTEGKVKLVAVADAFWDVIDDQLKQIANSVKGKPNEFNPDDVLKFGGLDAYKQVIESDIDMVILATPPGFRPYHYAHAVDHGRNVFMEKPVATDPSGVRLVLEKTKLAKEKNLKVGVGLQRRHEAAYKELIQLVHDGVIGDLQYSRVYWNAGGVWEPKKNRNQVKTEMEYQIWNWYYYNWLCGDHICEQHIHNLDIGNWLKNAVPVSAHGMGGRQVRVDKRYGEIYDHHAVEYTYADGSKMISQCRHIPGCWNSVEEHATGTNGTIHLEGNQPRNCYLEMPNGTRITAKTKHANPYQVEHDDLFKAIRTNAKDYNEAEYGAMSTMTAILGRLCTYSGKVITMEQALKSEVSIMPKSFSFDAEAPINPNANGDYPIAIPGQSVVV
ncbi:MAG: Gfo/Idh/MocA family oxidoreductase [Planctomycetaceae bacterium]